MVLGVICVKKCIWIEFWWSGVPFLRYRPISKFILVGQLNGLQNILFLERSNNLILLTWVEDHSVKFQSYCVWIGDPGHCQWSIIGIDWLNDILLTSIVTNDHHGHSLFVRKWTFKDILLVAVTYQQLWEDQIHFLTSGSSGEPGSQSDSPENIASHANAPQSQL